MPPSLSFQPGEYYHLYNRGTDKRIIFDDASDYRRFLLLLYLCNSSAPVNLWRLQREQGPTLHIKNIERGTPLIAIGAYCLMPNHFHILAREIQENGITTFMRKLCTAYTMYFNLTRGRTGTLFQGKFKASHADSDEYLKYLFAYIHLNPKNPTSYPYSSYPAYAGRDTEFDTIISSKEFPDYFPTSDTFEESIHDWILTRAELEKNPV